ncbi:MAG TPA: TIGR03067 domain-containing protein [Gemmataceae bacterium]|nr:TIGR03067 domain-containing protein [Gemmataceae bacterium]
MMLIVVVGLLFAAADPKKDATKDELKKLQGTWEVISIVANGEKVPKEETAELKVIISGSKIVFKEPNKSDETTFKIDPAKKPKEIDITPPANAKEDGTLKGIYSLEDDNLKMCYNVSRKGGRPAEFATKARDGRVLFVLKRAKP